MCLPVQVLEQLSCQVGYLMGPRDHCHWEKRVACGRMASESTLPPPLCCINAGVGGVTVRGCGKQLGSLTSGSSSWDPQEPGNRKGLFNRGQRGDGMGLILVSSGSWQVSAKGACPGPLAHGMIVVLGLLGFHCKEDLSVMR